MAQSVKVGRNRWILLYDGRAMDLTEYLTNIRELLRMDSAKFGLMVERQVQVRVLPRVAGPRAALEGPLWELLILCLDGHDAEVPELSDPLWERALEAVANRRALGAETEAVFPTAAAAIVEAMTALRETGVYPPPTLRR